MVAPLLKQMSRPPSPQQQSQWTQTELLPRAHSIDDLVQTGRKSTSLRKLAVPKRSNIQTKPDEKARGSADPIIVTESEDISEPSRSNQSQRKSAVPQPKAINGNMKGKGKVQAVQHDDPIDLDPADGVSDASDVDMPIPVPRPRPSPIAVSAKDENLQRKLLQVKVFLQTKKNNIAV